MFDFIKVNYELFLLFDNLSMQLDCRNFKRKISRINFARLHLKRVRPVLVPVWIAQVFPLN